MLTLYGSALSRAARSLVALEELGLAYAHVPLKPRPGTADRETLMGLNPNGHIPVLTDGELTLWESMAINLYLGDRYGGPAWPQAPAARAALYQWSFWAQTEVDRADWNLHRRQGDDAQRAADRDGLIRALGVLEAALAPGPWLLGEAFTLADVNVGATLSQPNERGLIGWQRLDPAAEGLPRIAAWLAALAARPAYQRVAALP